MKTYKVWTLHGKIANFSAESIEQAKVMTMKIVKTKDIKHPEIFLREEGSYIKHYREKYGVSKKGAVTWTNWKYIDER